MDDPGACTRFCYEIQCCQYWILVVPTCFLSIFSPNKQRTSWLPAMASQLPWLKLILNEEPPPPVNWRNQAVTQPIGPVSHSTSQAGAGREPHSKRKPKAQTKDRAEWGHIKDRFRELYMEQDMDLNDVAAKLEKESQFTATWVLSYSYSCLFAQRVSKKKPRTLDTALRSMSSSWQC